MHDKSRTDAIEPAEAADDRGHMRRRGFITAASAGGLAAAVAFMSPATAAEAAGGKKPGHPDVFNVKDFGAKGNGTADDRQAIQKAIDAAAAAGGGSVSLPAGVYSVSATLVITSSRTTLRGEGAASVIRAAAADGDIIRVERAAGTTGNVADLLFADFSITSAVQKTSGSAMRFDHVQDVRIANVQASSRTQVGSANNLWDSFTFRNFSMVTLDTVKIQAQNTGLSIAGDPDGFGADIWVTGGSLIVGTQIGVHAGGGLGGLYLDEVVLYGNGTHVLVDDAIAGIANRELVFNNCVLDTSTAHGVDLQPNGVYVLSFNDTYGGNSGAGGTGHPDGAIIRAHPGSVLHPSGVVVNGCKFFNGIGSGIYAESGSWTIAGSDITLNGQGANGGYGVLLASGTSNNMVTGNTLRLNGAYPSARPVGVGVQIDAGVDKYVVTGNLLTDNSTGGVVDNGGANKVVADNLG